MKRFSDDNLICFRCFIENTKIRFLLNYQCNNVASAAICTYLGCFILWCFMPNLIKVTMVLWKLFFPGGCISQRQINIYLQLTSEMIHQTILGNLTQGSGLKGDWKVRIHNSDHTVSQLAGKGPSSASLCVWKQTTGGLLSPSAVRWSAKSLSVIMLRTFWH